MRILSSPVLHFIRNSPGFNRRTLGDLQTNQNTTQFETVFELQTIKYISLINRLKVYQITGTCIAVPCAGLLEMSNLVSEYTLLTTSYIGITAAALLSVATLPFRNVIGFLYISKDNSLIKIASVDYWGKRSDKIIKLDEWTPLYDLPQSKIDAFYLSPQLTDGSNYKLLIKFGRILNKEKIVLLE